MHNFELFGAPHLLSFVTILSAASILIVLYRRHSRLQKTIRYGLATCTLLSYPLHIALASIFSYQLDLETTLPLHLCDLAAIFGGTALFTKSQKLAEITYFWGLAATLQGLLTPDIQHSFPNPEFIAFFWNHGFVVITALFLPLAMAWRPRVKAHWYVFGMTQIYLILALTVNFSLGTNYGYLHHKPSTASLLDYLPVWPGYILFLEILCLAFFLLLSLPFSTKSEK
ncbi:MAG: TIGR02206 family membrane protein [Rubritalea sp.]|uniref:YwaF family protein n=1 Tax=Rubritalea sp. TaxID=2109375 RepID=UPI003242591B